MLMRLGSLLFIVPAVLLIAFYWMDMSAANACTEQGLYFDTDTQQCTSQTTQVTPYYARHTLMVNVMILLSLVGALAMTWGMLIKGMQRDS